MKRYSKVKLITQKDNKESIEIDTVYDLKNNYNNKDMQELVDASYKLMDSDD